MGGARAGRVLPRRRPTQQLPPNFWHLLRRNCSARSPVYKHYSYRQILTSQMIFNYNPGGLIPLWFGSSGAKELRRLKKPINMKCVHGDKISKLNSVELSKFQSQFWKFTWVQLPINQQDFQLTNQNAWSLVNSNQKIQDLLSVRLYLWSLVKL